MLKIKADKMQDLEKFGFRKLNSLDGYVYFYNIYKSYGLYIEIEIVQDRTIVLNVNCDDVSIVELDIFYELFANNMVEKVAE